MPSELKPIWDELARAFGAGAVRVDLRLDKGYFCELTVIAPDGARQTLGEWLGGDFLDDLLSAALKRYNFVQFLATGRQERYGVCVQNWNGDQWELQVGQGPTPERALLDAMHNWEKKYGS